MVAAYAERREGAPARQILWRYLSGFPEFSLLTRTRHGWMTYSNKDGAIGHRLFVDGQFEYPVIARVIALLRDLGLARGGLLVDVGANIGTVTVTLLREGVFRRAVAVEPVPGYCRRLSRNLLLNGLRQQFEWFRPLWAASRPPSP
jgi:hypothetical protein